MKKQFLIAICVAVAAFAAVVAQQPSPQPPAAVPPPQATMTLPPQAQASLLAGQIISQVTTLLNNVIQVIDNGVPAQQGQAAIESKDIQAALGAENIMKLRSIVAMLSHSPSSPAPTPVASATSGPMNASPSPEPK